MGLARFLSFCQDVSEANGNAHPVLVAHNASFDNHMLLNNCWQAGIDVPAQWGSLCTFQTARALADVLPAETQAEYMPNCKLGTLARKFGCV